MKYPLSFFAVMCFLISCQTSKTGTEEINYHSEDLRPQFHFTPPSMWMNDPNGMVYKDGEYHLFYQHNPDSTVWGPMHWGHAVSRDMVHWEHLPIALYPDSLGTIFSGSAVVDVNNTSGLGTADNPPMVAIFTYHNAQMEQQGRNNYQTQGIAFSIDNGRTWTKYEGNPVLQNPGIRDFRDPKVSWYEPGQKWIMALAVKDRISFYSSDNLKSWKLESDFGANLGAHGGVWECPDLFEMNIEGSGEKKWVLLVSINPGGPNGGSATQYFIGDFDGKRFTLDEEFKADLREEGIWIDYGTDNYAGVTWSNIPQEDNRHLFMGWMSNWLYANVVPTENWRSAMTVARELILQETPEGLRLVSNPVKEIESLYREKHTLNPQQFSEALNISQLLGFTGATYELSMEADAGNKAFAVELFNDQDEKVIIGYNPDSQRFYINRSNLGDIDFSDAFAGIHYGPRLSNDPSVKLRLLVDVASVELFADNGQTAMTEIFFPQEKLDKVRLVSDESISIRSLSITDLASIWNSEI